MIAVLAREVAAPRERLRRMLLRVAGIAGVDLVTQGVRILIVAWPLPAIDVVFILIEIARNGLIVAVSLSLALDFFENGGAALAARVRWAVLIGVSAGAVVVSSAFISSNVSVRLGLADSPASLELHTLWHNSVVTILTILYLTRRRESSRAELRRQHHASGLDQTRRRLALVSAQATQSRLDPQMLFDCLSRARCVYAGDLDRGDLLLERLTHYLRLTLSVGSTTTSTLGREAALAAARVDVERRDDDPVLRIEIGPGLDAVDFPPDLLGPLAHDWLAGASMVGAGALQIAATQADGWVRVRLLGPGAPPAKAVAQCARLVAVFTSGRGVVRTDAAEPSCVHLEVPHAA